MFNLNGSRRPLSCYDESTTKYKSLYCIMIYDYLRYYYDHLLTIAPSSVTLLVHERGNSYSGVLVIIKK